MWLRLSGQGGRTIIIDADKITDIHEETNGSRIFFATSITDKENKSIVRSVKVKEEVQQIAEALRAKDVQA